MEEQYNDKSISLLREVVKTGVLQAELNSRIRKHLIQYKKKIDWSIKDIHLLAKFHNIKLKKGVAEGVVKGLIPSKKYTWQQIIDKIQKFS